MNYLVGLNGESYARGSSSSPDDIRAFDSNFKISYKRPISETNRKNCFGVIEGTEGAPLKLFWRGIARGYREIINCSIQNGIKSSGSFSAFCWPDSDYSKRVLCNYPLKCINASYNVVYSDRIFDVSVEPQYTEATSTNWRAAAAAGGISNLWDKALSKFNIELDAVGGYKYDTEHIVGWSKDTEWELYCPDWTNTWQLSPKQSINDKTVYDGATVTTSGWYAGQEMIAGTHRNASGSMPFTFVNSTTNTTNMFYSVGLYNTGVKNSEIYQNEQDFQYSSSDTFNVLNQTIEKGLPILAGKKEEKVEFKPVIKTVKCFNEAGVYVTNMNEVDIYLSYVPFTEKNITTDPVKVEKPDKTKVNYVTTSGRKGDIKFEMDKSSVVYMQLMPHFESTETVGPNSFWEIVLDLTGDGGSFVLESSV